MPEYKVSESDVGKRVDEILFSTGEFLSRSKAQALIKEGEVLLNEKPCKAGNKVDLGDIITYSLPKQVPTDLIGENIPLDVIYEDDYLIVVNKPAGQVVHYGNGVEQGTTLVEAVLAHCPLSTAAGTLRPGVVHRLDQATSGVMLFAKTDVAYRELTRMFAERRIHKTYYAFVHGIPKLHSGMIDAPIGRHQTDRKRMAVVKDGRRAVTHWQVLERYGDATFLHVELETGRTHQIRVHMAYEKHPILGDPVYGSIAPKLGLYSQALHGYRLQFTHPISGEQMVFTAPLPEDFITALKRLSINGTVPEWVTKGEL